MTNPCNKCLVQAACTSVCGPKQDYTKYVINVLTDIINICENSQADAKEIHAWHTYAVSKCEENTRQCQAILERCINI